MFHKFLLSFFILALSVNVFALHRHHKTSLYINLDKESKKIQMALVIDSLDLQTVLQRELLLALKDSEHKHEIFLEDFTKDKPNMAVKVAMSFFNKNLAFKHAGKNLKIKWFKIDLGTKVSTVYFTADVEDMKSLKGLEVLNTVLFDFNTNHVNFIYVTGTSKKSYQTSLDHKIKRVVLE